MQFVLNELKSAKQYVEARRRQADKVDISHILTGFADSLIKETNSNRLNSAEISKIVDELNSSPYDEDQTISIIKLLDSKLLEGMADSESQGSADHSASKQCEVSAATKSTLLAWHNYFSNDDIDKLSDAHRSWYVKSEHAVFRSRSWGCVDPCEQSVKSLLALLLKLNFVADLPDALTKFRYFNDLNRCSYQNRLLVSRRLYLQQ